MIHPGHTATGGWRGERDPLARGPSGLCPGSSERRKRARRPHPTSLSAVALALHRRERATKNSKRETEIFVSLKMIMRLYLLFLYNKNLFFHHPPVFALFLFYEKKTCTKRKVGRGTEPALSARTNRSRAPTTSSRAVLAPPSTPIGFARQPS